MRVMLKKSVADEICRYWGLPLVKAYNPRDPKFEYFKRKIIAHLDKLERQEAQEMRKSLAYFERLEKARHATYNIGETATWNGKKYIKGPDKKWRRYYEGHSKQVESTITRLKGQARKCQNSSELWDLVTNNWGRFMDTDKMPLPIVREFHQYVSTIEDEINAGVSVENRTAHRAKRKRTAAGAKRKLKPAGDKVKPESDGKSELQVKLAQVNENIEAKQAELEEQTAITDRAREQWHSTDRRANRKKYKEIEAKYEEEKAKQYKIERELHDLNLDRITVEQEIKPIKPLQDIIETGAREIAHGYANIYGEKLKKEGFLQAKLSDDVFFDALRWEAQKQWQELSSPLSAEVRRGQDGMYMYYFFKQVEDKVVNLLNQLAGSGTDFDAAEKERKRRADEFRRQSDEEQQKRAELYAQERRERAQRAAETRKRNATQRALKKENPLDDPHLPSPFEVGMQKWETAVYERMFPNEKKLADWKIPNPLENYSGWENAVWAEREEKERRHKLLMKNPEYRARYQAYDRAQKKAAREFVERGVREYDRKMREAGIEHPGFAGMFSNYLEQHQDPKAMLRQQAGESSTKKRKK